MTEEQRKTEINRIRRVRAKLNAQIEAQILELSKKKMSEELRKAELNALVKSRAKNNADTKAQLIRLGVKYAQRTPPPRPVLECDCADCNCENCTCEEKTAIVEIKDQANEMLDHIDRVVSYQAQPHMNHPRSEIAIADNGMPDSTEIEKVRCEVAEVQGTMNMLARFLATQNVKVVDPQPYIQKLAHVEAVACCQARTHYGAVPHQYIQATPYVALQSNGQPKNSEIEKVKTEVVEVKDAVNSLAKAFDSYNMGKMHGAIESFKNNQQPIYMQQPQPQIQPVIVQTPHQQVHGQPVIVNTVPTFTQPEPHQVPPAHHMPSESKQQGPSGLAEMLAKMGEKLDGLAEEMK